VTARGNERRSIFLGDADTDRAAFLDLLASSCQRFNWMLRAYCLMTNDYQLLVEPPGWELIQGHAPARWCVHGVCQLHPPGVAGSSFQHRFKAISVERESYLLKLGR